VTVNLNELSIENDGNFPDVKSVDNSVIIEEAHLRILFRNQKSELIKLIQQSNCVVGAVAWLTDTDILAALRNVDYVSIVVQKEDFLRPDLGAKRGWKNELRTAYGALRNLSARFSWPGMMGSLSIASDPTIEPIRCVGNHNLSKTPAFPRMHNKFLVFGNAESSENDVEAIQFRFHTAWTGSYNLTFNASNSLENAVVIRSEAAAQAYYNEFCQIFALSESLDWTSDWCAPEFRIGT